MVVGRDESMVINRLQVEVITAINDIGLTEKINYFLESIYPDDFFDIKYQKEGNYYTAMVIYRKDMEVKYK